MSKREAHKKAFELERTARMSVVPKRCARTLLLATVVMGMIGCATQRTPAPIEAGVASSLQSARVDTVTATGDRIADTALSMLGTPYRYGGRGPGGFDCSGLVYYAYQQAGIEVPRTAKNQKKAARRINRQSLSRGDLLFFNVSWKSGHVGIYVGDDRFVHAPSSGKRVSIARLDEGYFASRVDRAARLHD
jgi:cell wall-associated NlpC family hydrolase